MSATTEIPIASESAGLLAGGLLAGGLAERLTRAVYHWLHGATPQPFVRELIIKAMDERERRKAPETRDPACRS